MYVLVLGGDLRYLEIINNLCSRCSVDVVGCKNIFINDKINNVSIDSIDVSKYDIIVLPVNGVMDGNTIYCRFNNESISISDDFFVNSKENVSIFSGISTPCLEKLLAISNRKCTYMMNDINVIRENSILTVEGIVADVILNTEKSLNGSNILVFGYGNIGQVLVKYLNLLGANVTVSIIENDDKLILDNQGVSCFFSNNVDDLISSISCTDVIINTVPSTVIDNSLIKYINRDAYVLDIASHPHGIDREVLDEFFIKNKLYLGIPGKVAPKTSGKILSKKINEVMGD